MDQRVLASVWRQPGRSTRAIVDLDAIMTNVAEIRSAVGPRTCVMAVVKANGYGHGAVAVARAAIEAGAGYLGVATVDEGVQLREHGLTTPIVVLGPIDDSEIEFAIGRGLEPMVGDRSSAEVIADRAERLGLEQPVHLHLKVDTGMQRYGSAPGSAVDVATYIVSHAKLRLKGIATHFARADEEEEHPTTEQVSLFERVLEALSTAGISAPLVHMANSAAVLRSRSFDRDLVRLGIAMYGLDPSPFMPTGRNMRPAMTIISRIRRLSRISPGDPVSYGAEYRATGDETVALVPVGYADGYRRGLSNSGWMGVDGFRCPVRGRVCMDQTVIGIPGAAEVANGDTVLVAGAFANTSAPSFDDVAAVLGTINYEVAAGIDRRVPRFYIRGGIVVGVEDLFGLRALMSPVTNA